MIRGLLPSVDKHVSLDMQLTKFNTRGHHPMLLHFKKRKIDVLALYARMSRERMCDIFLHPGQMSVICHMYSKLRQDMTAEYHVSVK